MDRWEGSLHNLIIYFVKIEVSFDNPEFMLELLFCLFFHLVGVHFISRLVKSCKVKEAGVGQRFGRIDGAG